MSLFLSVNGAVSVYVRFKLCRLVAGGEVWAVVRLSFVGVREDGSESGTSIAFSVNSLCCGLAFSSSGLGGPGLRLLVGEASGLSSISSGLADRGRKLASNGFPESSAPAGPVRGPIRCVWEEKPGMLFAPTSFALASSSSIPCISWSPLTRA